MLTGAMRAARTAGVLRLERVWVVAVPVVLMVVFARVQMLLFVHWSCCSFYLTHPYAEMVGRGGPMSLRTALVVTGAATTAYALLWAIQATVEYSHEVRHRGRRLVFRGGPPGRLLVFGSMFVLLAYAMTLVVSIPTADDVLARAKAGFRARRATDFSGAVIHDVPGIRAFCRQSLEDPARPQQFLAAMALTRLGEGSDRTVALLRSITREEFLDPQNESLILDMVRISSGNMRSWEFRGLSWRVQNEMGEQLWQKFRRECIP